jgi:hypothetical protein
MFHLLGQGFNNAGINNLIRGSFDLQATKDAVQTVVGKDGRVKSIQKAEAEQALLNHDKTQHWVDLMLGMTKKQQDEYEHECTTQAKQAESADQGYDFDDTHSVNPVAGQPDNGTAFTITGKKVWERLPTTWSWWEAMTQIWRNLQQISTKMRTGGQTVWT